MGRITADLIMRGASRHDAARFSVNRFRKSPS
jgi:hypothetical protein